MGCTFLLCTYRGFHPPTFFIPLYIAIYPLLSHPLTFAGNGVDRLFFPFHRGYPSMCIH